jgi:hypothetical protein
MVKALSSIFIRRLLLAFILVSLSLATDPPYTYTSYLQLSDTFGYITRTVKQGIKPVASGTRTSTTISTIGSNPYTYNIITVISIILPVGTLPEESLEPYLPEPLLDEVPVTHLLLFQPVRFTGPATCRFPYTVDVTYSIGYVPNELLYVLSPTSTTSSIEYPVRTYTGGSWFGDSVTFTSTYTATVNYISLYLKSDVIPVSVFTTIGVASLVSMCFNPTASYPEYSAAVPQTQTSVPNLASHSSPQWVFAHIIWVSVLMAVMYY